jgi:hypothetical protein
MPHHAWHKVPDRGQREQPVRGSLRSPVWSSASAISGAPL